MGHQQDKKIYLDKLIRQVLSLKVEAKQQINNNNNNLLLRNNNNLIYK